LHASCFSTAPRWFFQDGQFTNSPVGGPVRTFLPTATFGKIRLTITAGALDKLRAEAREFVPAPSK